MFFSFFLKYLFSSKSISLVRFISFICILGFAISLSSLIIVISVMSGFGISTQNRLLAQEPHLVVYGEGQDRKSFFPSVQNFLNMHLEDIHLSRFFETQDVILKSSTGQYSGALAKGYHRPQLLEFVKPYENQYLQDTNQNVEWSLSLKNTEKKQMNHSVYLSSDVAYLMSLFEGDIFYVMPADHLLLPVTEMTPPERVSLYSSLSFDAFSKMSRTLFYEIGTLPSLVQTASLSYGVEVFLKNPNGFAILKKSLGNHFEVESWKDRHSALFFALRLEKAIMAVFLFLAILISSFSISSMTRLLLAQKRNDISILMVMGWPVQKIQKLFLKISLVLSFIGMVSGLLLAIGVCFFLKYNTIPLLPSIYYDRFIPVDMNIFVFVFSALLTFLLAFLISWLSVYSYTLPSSLNLKKSF